MGCGASAVPSKPADLAAMEKAMPIADSLPRELLPHPKDAAYKCAVVGFVVPGAWNTDKDKNAVRYDSVPIANGLIHAGIACDLINYTPEDHDGFAKKIEEYDGLVVRINPGQLNTAVGEGAQKRFDELMMNMKNKGKPVWPSPEVMKMLGSKEALVKVKDLNCGLPDSAIYFTPEELEESFKVTAAFQPRVIKQNRGSSGEGIWLCWLAEKEYCANLGDAKLEDDDKLKLMEMNDNHVEYHTVREFLDWCVYGRDKGDAVWESKGKGKYLEGGRAAEAQLVDQRLCPRIKEGEVRFQMAGNTLFSIIHKKPKGDGFSAVGGVAEYSFFTPDAPEYAELKAAFEKDLPTIMSVLDLADSPLPLLWTADWIPVDNHKAPFVVCEFNCSCVGISQFLAACGPDKDLKDVAEKDLAEGYRLVNLIGQKALQGLQQTVKKERPEPRDR
uniref:DUF6815 domain-containing protein n=1 Tax=Chromera velia CCMP2878 TaxID=1169474 RepID=A0A0G4I4C1_9ALVE|eukprot:Cvel_10850.t1-p1 / transcript=Cvel_10850.t1 / gene=Cvel_10850 / organism=Chromera_velia_CCMP2878 / gene_product=hypothetical protein / transcript_product=hypothetical protein / location=Cvel_scaffold664:35815-38543(+) / protein_length=443 / sequence_SO=supercontig / SO=protein_coding / is_pseudo=false